MKQILWVFASVLLLIGCRNEKSNNEEIATATTEELEKPSQETGELEVSPISHATMALRWGSKTIYVDPVGGAALFEEMDSPNLVLVTDIHGDHMDAETLTALDLKDVKIVVPQAVKEQLPESLQKNLLVLENGKSIEESGFTITAIPMYNLPEAKDAMHVKGRGNGYLLEANGKRVYIAGDTEDIPEMRALENIDVAFVPMNLPYTMPATQAADGVLAFSPKKVYPYHYRGKPGFEDVEEFKKIVNDKNKGIEVVLLDWYPKSK